MKKIYFLTVPKPGTELRLHMPRKIGAIHPSDHQVHHYPRSQGKQPLRQFSVQTGQTSQKQQPSGITEQQPVRCSPAFYRFRTVILHAKKTHQYDAPFIDSIHTGHLHASCSVRRSDSSHSFSYQTSALNRILLSTAASITSGPENASKFYIFT